MGHGAWFHTTAATSSADVLYAVQKGDLYRASPVDGHYTKLSSGWGDTKCLAYHGGLVYIIYKSDGRLFLYSSQWKTRNTDSIRNCIAMSKIAFTRKVLSRMRHAFEAVSRQLDDRSL